MRPLGIVLAVVSAALLLSFPENAARYSQIYSNLPTIVLLVAFFLMPAAIATATVESLTQNKDVDRVARAAQSTAAMTDRTASPISKGAVEAPPAVGVVAADRLAADNELEARLQRSIDQRFQELARAGTRAPNSASSASLATQAAAAISRMDNLVASGATGVAMASPLVTDRDLEVWIQNQIDLRLQELVRTRTRAAEAESSAALAATAAAITRIADAMGSTAAKPLTPEGKPPPPST